MTTFRGKGRKAKTLERPLAVLAEVEKALGPLPEALRPRIIDEGPCGDGRLHRWSRLTSETLVGGRFSYMSRYCLDCGFTSGSLREAASYSEAV